MTNFPSHFVRGLVEKILRPSGILPKENRDDLSRFCGRLFPSVIAHEAAETEFDPLGLRPLPLARVCPDLSGGGLFYLFFIKNKYDATCWAMTFLRGKGENRTDKGTLTAPSGSIRETPVKNKQYVNKSYFLVRVYNENNLNLFVSID